MSLFLCIGKTSRGIRVSLLDPAVSMLLKSSVGNKYQTTFNVVAICVWQPAIVLLKVRLRARAYDDVSSPKSPSAREQIYDTVAHVLCTQPERVP